MHTARFQSGVVECTVSALIIYTCKELQSAGKTAQ